MALASQALASNALCPPNARGGRPVSSSGSRDSLGEVSQEVSDDDKRPACQRDAKHKLLMGSVNHILTLCALCEWRDKRRGTEGEERMGEDRGEGANESGDESQGNAGQHSSPCRLCQYTFTC